MKDIKIYYPKIKKEFWCVEFCKIFLTTGISSLACRKCENNVGSGKNKKGWWIKCKCLDVALGKNEDVYT